MIRAGSIHCQGQKLRLEAKFPIMAESRRSRVPLKSPKPLAQVFREGKGVFAKRAQGLVRLYRLQLEWEKIVGAELARRTRPKEFRGKTLTIAVESPVWAQHLSFMREKILDLLSGRLHETVENLRFVNSALPQMPKEKPEAAKPVVTFRKSRGEAPKEEISTILERLRRRAAELKAQREKNRP
jgi:predicted nucleic acid-binding Zn ribbon protein